MTAQPIIGEVAAQSQKMYNMYSERLNTETIYEHVTPEIKEELLDFFEKFAMTNLYS